LKEIYNDIIDEKIYSEILDNGLNVFMIIRNNYVHKYALFATKYGSIDKKFISPHSGEEVDTIDGIAHFLEHKLFEDELENTFDKFAKLGASTNAYTGVSSTNYLFSTTSNFEEALLNLLDFVQTPYFTDENVEKEKGIIAQEIKMYEDNPYWQLYYNLLKGIYHFHPVRNDIAGTVNDIYKIKKEDLYLCYNTFYHPSNMALFLIGDFDRQKVLESIINNQSKKKYPVQNQIKRIFPTEPLVIKEEELKKKMNVSLPLFCLGYKETNLNITSRELIKQEFANNILLELILGKGTELFQSLYEKGLVNDNFSFNYTSNTSFGHSQISSESRDPYMAYDILIKGIEDAYKFIDEENYSRIYKKYLGDFIEGFNSLEFIASEFISLYFRDINLFEVFDIFQEINLEFLINNYMNFFNKERAVLSIIEA
jgi:predicted Zn-dependent peptidase